MKKKKQHSTPSLLKQSEMFTAKTIELENSPKFQSNDCLLAKEQLVSVGNGWYEYTVYIKPIDYLGTINKTSDAYTELPLVCYKAIELYSNIRSKEIERRINNTDNPFKSFVYCEHIK